MQADVMVVGAGTAGSYFAWQMGKAGYKVLILESKKLENLGKHIEIFHMEMIRFDEFGIPHPGTAGSVRAREVGRQAHSCPACGCWAYPFPSGGKSSTHLPIFV